MSDLSIPGVTGKIDTKTMVAALMEPDRVKLRNKEDEVDGLHEQKRVWQGLKGRLSQLEAASRELYSFQNPFRSKAAASSDELALRATVTREAVRETHEFRILQTARSDRFISEALDKDFSAPSGTYRFQVGEEEVSFRFRGGSLDELADTINRRGDRLVSARVVRNTESTRVFIIEAKKEGASNALVFQEAASEFGVKSGLLKQTGQTLTVPPLETAAVRSASGSAVDMREEVGLRLSPGGSATLPFATGPALNKKIMLEISFNVAALSQTEYGAPTAPSGPAVLESGRGTFEGHSVPNEPSQFLMPPWQPKPPPERVDDMRVVSATGGGRTIDLPDLELRDGPQVLRIPIGETLGGLDSLEFNNRNTHREILISEIRLFDPTARGAYRAVNPLSEAQDAVLEMDGIRVTRESNDIDDLLPGVNLTLLKETDHRVELIVDTDVEAIKDSLIEFVGYYNQLLTQIDILSRNDPQIVEEVRYFTDDEREKAMEQLGILHGDLALNQMKNGLRTTLVTPYPTSAGREMSMLVQMGIATDTGRPGSTSTLSGTKLRGYLEIDEDKLEEVLDRYPEAVGELFGSDTDGDFVVDSGLAFAVAQRLRPYIRTGGLIGSRLAGLDTTVARRQRDIETMNRQIEQKEARLRREYTMMEGMLNSMERSSRSIDNFSRNNNNSGGR